MTDWNELRLPTLKERVEIYLRAVYGERKTTREEYLRVQNRILNEMADNLVDAMVEDILNTPGDELLREVEEDYGDPLALSKEFDRILEHAIKIVDGK